MIEGAKDGGGAPKKTCPQCQKGYPVDVNYCPVDGSQLPDTGTHVGTLLLGQIELREVCGHGSMGTVYRAWQRTMERTVAVKILRRDLLRDAMVVKRFRREAQAVARISHPNIITVYLVGNTEDGLPFLVMEYVQGESLESVCETAGPLPTGRALNIGRQIASALAEAHDQQIVHRDLKPANILLTDKRGSPDFVKVVDFGIAKILRGADESNITQTGAIFGTPYYLSPEQASGAEVDHRCDLYSLGVILFRMVTGRLPFSSSSGMEVLVQHLKQPPPRPRDIVPSIPTAVEALILRAMQKDPTARPQSAEAMMEEMTRLLDQIGCAETLIVPIGMPLSSPGASPTSAPTASSSRPASSDPRFSVPADSDLYDQPSPATRAHAPAETTAALRRRFSWGQRALLHLAISTTCVAVGGGLGALVHHLEQRRAAAAARPSPGEDRPAPAHRSLDGDVASNVDAASDPRDAALSKADVPTKEATTRKPRRRRSKRSHTHRRHRPHTVKKKPVKLLDIKPVGPGPPAKLDDSDHDPRKNEEIYDLVD